MLQLSRIHFNDYGRTLFARVNFTVQPGEIWQIVGDNGAGKTTLLRIIAGLAQPGRGQVLWQGKSIIQQRSYYAQNMSYIGHQPAIPAAITVSEYLQIISVLRGYIASNQAQQMLHEIGLSAQTNQLTDGLSSGQKRRLALLKLALFPAPLWILDEPFVALDKKACHWLEQMCLTHVAQGGMVIFTSHQPISCFTQCLHQIHLVNEDAS